MRGRFIATLLPALLAAGCQGNSTPPPRTNPNCTTAADIVLGPPAPSDPVYWPGQRVEAVLVWMPMERCQEALPEITSVALEVTSPSGLPVPEATATAPISKPDQWGNSWLFETTVSFTANEEGPYHVLVTFNPNGGLLQKDLWVVLDRTAQAPSSQAWAPQRWTHLEQTPAGAVVCSDPGTYQLYRGTTVLDGGQGRFHTAGNAVWFCDQNGALTRSLDTGSGELQQTATWAGQFECRAFAVTEDAALMWQTDKLVLVRFDGTALVSDAQIHLGLTSRPTAVAWNPDAGTVAMGHEGGWTRFQFPSGASAPAPAWTTTEGAVLQSPEGIWVTANLSSLRYIPADLAAPVMNVNLPGGWQIAGAAWENFKVGQWPTFFAVSSYDPLTGPAQGTDPIDATQALVPVFRGDRAQLAHYRAPKGATFVEVTQGKLRATQGTTQLFWPIDP